MTTTMIEGRAKGARISNLEDMTTGGSHSTQTANSTLSASSQSTSRPPSNSTVWTPFPFPTKILFLLSLPHSLKLETIPFPVQMGEYSQTLEEILWSPQSLEKADSRQLSVLILFHLTTQLSITNKRAYLIQLWTNQARKLVHWISWM